MTNRTDRLNHLRTLDPATHYRHIYRDMVQLEFPRELELAFYLAFCRPFAYPPVSRVTAHTKEIDARNRKRANDTMILMYTLYEYGFDDSLGRAALRKINQIHRPWRATNTNDDYLYVLATLVVPPLRFLDTYGWRQPCCHEREATHRFYQTLARHMGITNYPDTYPDLTHWFDTFEAAHLAPDPANKALMTSMHNALTARLPRGLRWVTINALDSLLDEPVRHAIGLRRPPLPVRAGTHLLLRAMARRTRRSPPRHEPVFVFGQPIPGIYPDGYTIDDIGPGDQTHLAATLPNQTDTDPTGPASPPT